jgi:hypothetical protein
LSNSVGPNCSAEALYPSFSTCRSYELFTGETVRQSDLICRLASDIGHDARYSSRSPDIGREADKIVLTVSPPRW